MKKGPKKSEKFQKKLLHSLERAENAENVWENYGKSWEIPEINVQKFQNIPEKF